MLAVAGSRALELMKQNPSKWGVTFTIVIQANKMEKCLFVIIQFCAWHFFVCFILYAQNCITGVFPC